MSEAPKAGRPVPKPNTYVDTTPFWDGAKRKELVLQFCKDTQQFQHYPRPVSIYTGSRNLEWRRVSGRGKVYANTVIRIPGPGIDGRIPLPVVTVDLEEGARILGNIIDSPIDQVKIGASVEVAWDHLADDIYYPAFRLV